jgi:hypothetical protein
MDAQMAFLAQLPVDNDTAFQINCLLCGKFSRAFRMARDSGSRHFASVYRKELPVFLAHIRKKVKSKIRNGVRAGRSETLPA